MLQTRGASRDDDVTFRNALDHFDVGFVFQPDDERNKLDRRRFGGDVNPEDAASARPRHDSLARHSHHPAAHAHTEPDTRVHPGLEAILRIRNFNLDLGRSGGRVENRCDACHMPDERLVGKRVHFNPRLDSFIDQPEVSLHEVGDEPDQA